jgi:hypothetical protein
MLQVLIESLVTVTVLLLVEVYSQTVLLLTLLVFGIIFRAHKMLCLVSENAVQ